MEFFLAEIKMPSTPTPFPLLRHKLSLLLGANDYKKLDHFHSTQRRGRVLAEMLGFHVETIL